METFARLRWFAIKTNGCNRSLQGLPLEYLSVILSAIVHAKSDCECVQRGGRRQSSAFCSHFQKTETYVISCLRRATSAESQIAESAGKSTGSGREGERQSWVNRQLDSFGAFQQLPEAVGCSGACLVQGEEKGDALEPEAEVEGCANAITCASANVTVKHRNRVSKTATTTATTTRTTNNQRING